MSQNETARRIFYRRAFKLIVLSLLLNLTIESLSRHSLVDAALFACTTPHAFLFTGDAGGMNTPSLIVLLSALPRFVIQWPSRFS